MNAPAVVAGDRTWWMERARHLGTDWHGTVPLWWLEYIECPHCGLAPCDEPIPAPARAPPPPRRSVRSTPQATIEAVLHCVRARGPSALQEPDNIERLSRCDSAAKAEINRRIAKKAAKT